MGNLETKLSQPYYAITEETTSNDYSPTSSSSLAVTASASHAQTASKALSTSRLATLNSISFCWTVKRANYNNEHKNACLFELKASSSSSSSADAAHHVKKNTGAGSGSQSLAHNKNLPYALNQIKYLKTLRHPNVVKYFYSEEPQPPSYATGKCLLITEGLRPLSIVIQQLNREQIIRGLFGITNALGFLHEKVLISHNNLNERCLYLNSQQTWKINDFELALPFSELTRDNLRKILPLKQKDAITPEEEEFNKSSSPGKIVPAHSVDAYGWAMLVIKIITAKQQQQQQQQQHESKATSSPYVSVVKGLFNSSYTHIDDEADSSSTKENTPEKRDQGVDDASSTTAINNGIIDPSVTSTTTNSDDASSQDTIASLEQQLEAYLSIEPSKRPTLKAALDMRIFNAYKYSSSSTSASMLLPNSQQQQQQFSPVYDSNSDLSIASSINNLDSLGWQSSPASPFLELISKVHDLAQLETHWTKLVDYLKPLMQHGHAKRHHSKHPLVAVNELLVEFLLSPFMFFSERVRTVIYPNVFMPRKGSRDDMSSSNRKFLSHFYSLVVKKASSSSSSPPEEHHEFEPFIDEDKFRALVVPRILNLFTMHISQIRIVLLEYFPFYVHHIQDLDALQYEILPELLLGLKDQNDQIVSLTFMCLAIMVQILGGEIVLGKNSASVSGKMKNNSGVGVNLLQSPRQKIFSDNIPKASIPIDHAKSEIKSPKAAPLMPDTATVIDSSKVTSSTKHLLSVASVTSDTSKQTNGVTKISSASDMSNMMLTSQDSIGAHNASDDPMRSIMLKHGANKPFSESMIALHDETESRGGDLNDSVSDIVRKQQQQQQMVTPSKSEASSSSPSVKFGNEDATSSNNSDDDDDDETDNDDNWTNWTTTVVKSTPPKQLLPPPPPPSLTASAEKRTIESLSLKMLHSRSSHGADERLGSEFDIKSINIKKTTKPVATSSAITTEDDLIESFLSEMQPVIKTAAAPAMATMSKTEEFELKQTTTSPSHKFSLKPTSTTAEAMASWGCDDEINLELVDNENK